MTEIPIITSRDISISEIGIPQVNTVVDNYTRIPLGPPVVVNIGTPIVNIPGCVEAHKTNNSKNSQIRTDDKKGLVTYCDSGVPSFDPILYEPEQMTITRSSGVNVPKDAPVVPETPGIPKSPDTPTAKIDCPTASQNAKEPIGELIQGFRKKVTEYKLIGNECIQITEDVPIPQQIVAGLPTGGQVVQVGGVAVIATTSALLAKPLADLLLKVVKPIIKKVMKKISKIRGKKVAIESLRDRQGQQRIRNRAIRVLRGME
jgi:hypothetical protein